MNDTNSTELNELAQAIKVMAFELGFAQTGITDCDTGEANDRLQAWLEKKFHGEMTYMERHRDLRQHPDKLVPGTVRIICVRMDYLPKEHQSKTILKDPHKAYVSRYALGRDYHKVIRQRLTQLAKKITSLAKNYNHQYRAFADSAPIFERHLAAKAGIGWVGKNTMIMNNHAGSWFFLGELFTNIPLPVDQRVSAHCGSCTACIDVCPTKAIVSPYQIDATKCISYLTIEHKGSIDPELRPLMGNRIYGCDDCQLFCPWNKFAQHTTIDDFKPRHHLQDSDLITLFSWTEATFLKNTQGSAIRRAGYISWLRNIAVALGNAPTSPDVVLALESRRHFPNPIVQEHVAWALARHQDNSKQLI